MALHGNFMGEAERLPGLMEQLREHGVRPRCGELLDTLRSLRSRGDIREDVDLDSVVDMCFGSYFAAYLRGDEDREHVPDRIAEVLWPAISSGRPGGDA